MSARHPPVDAPELPAPLVWTFDGRFETCLLDIEDTLQRLAKGDRLQPAWRLFLERLDRYGLPSAPRIRHRPHAGPLATLVVAYRH